ncbi:MAG TPA: hypothetical protein VHE61_03335 [Opitutaceae bacterium]|nr:hypothetical protein [Opitutaceae bacterium]
MTLSPEQKQSVAQWVSAGASLSDIQKKLAEQFQLSMTYRDVRFLIDDLNLELKDTAPKVDASDVTKAPPRATPPAAPAERKGFFDKAKEKLGLGKDEEPEAGPADEAEAEEFEEEAPAGASNVRVAVDKLVIPGALASGTVTFSDGVTAKWLVDQYGRPGLTEVSRPGYRPSAEDSRAFMQELSAALQRQGY